MNNSPSEFRAPFEPSTLLDVLRFRAEQEPERQAYVFLVDGETAEIGLSYGELDARARAIGALLQNRVQSGEPVLLLYPPGLEYIAAFFGCLYAGAVAVPVYPPKSNRHSLRLKAIAVDAQAKVALTTRSILSSPTFARSPELKVLQWLVTDNIDDGLAEEWRNPGITSNTLAFLQYTSGSTAQPKGVMLSHDHLLHNERMIQQAFQQTERSVIVGWLPLYHDMGLIGNVLQPLYAGARCILMSPAHFLQSPVRWLQAISRYKATTSGGPNFAYDLCTRKTTTEQRAQLDLSSWTVAFNGSEPVHPDTLDRFIVAFGPCGFRPEAFFPCYGLAEATLFVSGGPKSAPPIIHNIDGTALEHNRIVSVSAQKKDGVRVVACGRSWLDDEILIVDPESSKSCEPDAVGEIWLSGPSIAQGYWNRAEDSECTFGAYLADSGKGPYLRTGDLGFISDGQLFITGRLKDLIIIRGRNHYPQDIEQTVEQSHARLRPGCGAAFSIDVRGEERLVVVQEVDRHCQHQEVEEIIAAINHAVTAEHELTVYAVALIRPGTLPKTSSGKLQRHACRANFLNSNLDLIGEWRASISSQNDFDEFLSPTPERSVAAIEHWVRSQLAARLGEVESQIDINQSIANYGVDSLMAMEMIHSLEVNLNVILPATSFLQGYSIAQLAREILAQPVTCVINSDAIATAPTISHGQNALWFLHQLAPDSPAYNIAGAARILTELDVSALHQAFQALVDRHAALRTTFSAPDGEAIPNVHERMDVYFRYEDASNWTEASLNKRLTEETYEPFDLEDGPLLRVNLFRQSAKEHVLLLVVHHIVADFWSLALLVQELCVLYDAITDGTSADLAPLTLQYTDYARWQAQLVAGPEGERLRAYWQKHLSAIPAVLTLPTDRPRPPIQTYRGASHSFKLDVKLTSKIKNLARNHGATLYVVLLAAFQVLLYRHTNQKKFLVGSPTTGRNHARWGSLVGYFVNLLVLPARFSGNPDFKTFLEEVRQMVFAAFEHQEYPFSLLVERLQKERDPSRSPLFQVMFTLQQAPLFSQTKLTSFALNEAGTRVELGKLLLESMSVDEQVAQFDLTLAMAEVDGGLAATFQYNRDLFDAATIDRLALHYQTLLADIASHPEKRISDLRNFTQAEQQQLLHEWNATETNYSKTACVHQLFETQVQKTPDAIAFISQNQQITYEQLNHRANQLAHFLQGCGVGPDVPVGLCVERSPEMMVGLLGILKAGGAYLPIDPTYPQQRLAFMLKDAQVPLVLTQRSLIKSIPDSVRHRVCLDTDWKIATDWKTIAAGSKANPASLTTPGNLAYVIYTSGSTGQPKGVMVEHGNVLNFFAGMDRIIGEDGPGTWLAVTSISFDISVLELLWTVTRGFQVVIHAKQNEPMPRPKSIDTGRKMEFSLFYFASLEDEAAQDKYQLLIEGAKFADQHGFSAIWTPERHFHPFGGLYPNPSVIGATLAALTEQIQIRAGSVVLPLHNPIRVAEEWSLVDNLSKGRVGISFASGWHPDDFVLSPENYADRKEVMIHQLEMVRQLWRGESISLKGGHGNQVNVKTFPRPIQRELPTWITAAGDPQTFRLAGEAGANLLTHLLGQSIEELAEKITVYRKAWREHGHGPSSGHVTLMLHTFVEKSLEFVRAKVEKPFCDYLLSSIDLAKRLLRSAGQQVDSELTANDIEALLSHAFHRYYETSGLFGTPSSCLRLIDRLKEIGVDEVACLIDFGVDTDSVMSSLHYLDALRQHSNAENDDEPYSLHEELTRHNVTHLQCTPSLATTMTADQQVMASLSRLRRLVVGGEALPASLARQLQEAVPGEVRNMYGPTETTVWSTTYPLSEISNGVPIGRPLANTKIYILDDYFQPVPVGVPGELLIGGDGVVRGYLNRPDLTAERFMPDPFSGKPGARLYRTGDLACYLPDGNIEFMGRLDHQVKIRGHRIELAEIEATLRQHPAVSEAVVIAKEIAPGDVGLAAYLVPARRSNHSVRVRLTTLEADHLLVDRNRYKLPNGMVIAHHGSFQTSVIYKEIFEDEMYLKHGISFNEGDCVFDVGANIGLFTLFVAQNCENVKIYAFEPIPPNFELLRTNLALQGVDAKLFECGLSSKDEVATFTFYPQAAGMSGHFANVEGGKRSTQAIVSDWLQRVVPGNDAAILPEAELDQLLDEYFQAEQYSCRLRTLSDIIRENEIEQIDLLKIDVEGSEFDVLGGIREGDWQKIKQIVLEVHSRDLLERITSLLEAHGYNVAVDESFAIEQSRNGSDVHVSMLYALQPSTHERSSKVKQFELVGPPESSNGDLAIGDVRTFLKDKLPIYMIPAVFVVLEALPLTPNGKIDRQALPFPDDRRSEKENGFVAPRTPTEKMLAEIWTKLLGKEHLSVDDDFFDVGGHSLLATQLVTRIRASFSVDLTLRDFLKSSTIASLAEVVEESILAQSSEARVSEMLDLLEELGDDEARNMLDSR